MSETINENIDQESRTQEAQIPSATEGIQIDTAPPDSPKPKAITRDTVIQAMINGCKIAALKSKSRM